MLYDPPIVSEYQHYQFDTVDRCLNARERSAVQALSSHISVNSTSASVEYQLIFTHLLSE